VNLKQAAHAIFGHTKVLEDFMAERAQDGAGALEEEQSVKSARASVSTA